MPSSTRDRMILSTALLVRERGARATSIDDVLAHSGAPRGSVYHHFPGGRDELLREATRFAADYIAGRLAGDGDPLAKLDAFVEGYRADLVANDFRPGCPIVAVAIEDGAGLQDLAAEAFTRWEDLLAVSFRKAGVRRRAARDLAVTIIAGLEGALVMARAQKSVVPLDTVHRLLRAQLRGELQRGST
jgi:AcrR family transcriptional regulator